MKWRCRNPSTPGKGVDRCLRYAFELATKAQQEEKAYPGGQDQRPHLRFDLWERAFHEPWPSEYPDITPDYAHVDATCMWMVKNPEWFDVIVTDNLFGDIITDLGAMMQGGMGVAAGGNINPEGVSMFEPIGGSAPKYTGQNMMNPIAAIAAAQMMLEYLGEAKAAQAIDAGIKKTATMMQSMNAGRMGYTTTEVGDLVAKNAVAAL